MTSALAEGNARVLEELQSETAQLQQQCDQLRQHNEALSEATGIRVVRLYARKEMPTIAVGELVAVARIPRDWDVDKFIDQVRDGFIGNAP